MSCIPQPVQCSNTTSVELDVCVNRLEPNPHADGGCIPAPRRLMPYPRTLIARDKPYCPGGKNSVPPCLLSVAIALSTAAASSVVPSPTAPKSRTFTCTIPALVREVAGAAASAVQRVVATFRATPHATTTPNQPRCGLRQLRSGRQLIAQRHAGPNTRASVVVDYVFIRRARPRPHAAYY